MGAPWVTPCRCSLVPCSKPHLSFSGRELRFSYWSVLLGSATLVVYVAIFGILVSCKISYRGTLANQVIWRCCVWPSNCHGASEKIWVHRLLLFCWCYIFWHIWTHQTSITFGILGFTVSGLGNFDALTLSGRRRGSLAIKGRARRCSDRITKWLPARQGSFNTSQALTAAGPRYRGQYLPWRTPTAQPAINQKGSDWLVWMLCGLTSAPAVWV